MQDGQRYKAKKDIATGGVFLGLAILFLISTYRLTDHQLAQLSIRQFPLIVSWVIVLLSLLLMGKGYRALKSDGAPSESATPRPQIKELIRRPFVLRFAGVALLGVLYTRVFDHVGYLVATPGLLLGAMLLFGEKKWYRLVLIPIVVSFVLYHVFRTFFRVPLPVVGFSLI
jgi:putative tricarboxylic transport membrane protein